jgi:hypothetical protein
VVREVDKLAPGFVFHVCDEDRGERWQVVGHNLPPIYSVRFA